MKKVLCLLMVFAMMCSFAGCDSDDATPIRTMSPDDIVKPVQFGIPYTEAELEAQANKVLAEITMENGGTIKLELYPDIAPVTVENFTKLAGAGFYDGLTFHRIIEGFMIQGGDPAGNGSGGSEQKIKGEFAENGIENRITHQRGVISMARSQSPDSASSQFFIMHADNTALDGKYAAFGTVTEGMEVVDKIAESAKVEDDNGTVLPENQPVIKSIKITQ